MIRRQLIRLGAFACLAALTSLSIPAVAVAHDPASLKFADLPIGVASFGATQDDGWLYVYGGHTGKTHTYSKQQSLSSFQRVSLNEGGAWEELPGGPGLQGLALVAYKGAIYRIGGMTAKNEMGKEQDLYSLADVAKFDPQTKSWTELPALPEGRSSHGAAIVGDKLHVAGGWILNGKEEPAWLTTALVMDLASEKPEWKPLPAPSFQRRALMATAFEGKIYVTGGLTADGVSKDVDVFDPQSQKWTKGPSVPGMPMNGNGLAAFGAEKSLYLSGMDGKVYRLNAARDGWDVVGRLEQPRIHHRLASAGHGALLAVAGATMEANLKTVSLVQFEGKHKESR